MRSSGQTIACAIVCMLLSPYSMVAQPWPQGMQEYFVSVAAERYSTTRGTRSDGTSYRFSDGGRFESDRFGLFMKAGLSDDVTLFGSVALMRSTYNSSSLVKRSSGLSDAEVGIDVNLAMQPFAASAGATYISPVLYDQGVDPSLGLGQHALQVGTAAGIGSQVAGIRMWLSGEIGYRHYFGSVSDQVRGTGTVGAVPLSATMVIVQTNIIRSLSPNSGQQNLNPNAIPGFSLVKTSVMVVQKIHGPASGVLAFTRDLWSQSAGDGFAVSLGVWLDLDRGRSDP